MTKIEFEKLTPVPLRTNAINAYNYRLIILLQINISTTFALPKSTANRMWSIWFDVRCWADFMAGLALKSVNLSLISLRYQNHTYPSYVLTHIPYIAIARSTLENLSSITCNFYCTIMVLHNVDRNLVVNTRYEIGPEITRLHLAVFHH